MPLGLQHVLISSCLVTIKKAENYGLLTNILFSSPVLPHLPKGKRNSLKICSSSNFSNVKESTFEYFELSHTITLRSHQSKPFFYYFVGFFVCLPFFFLMKRIIVLLDLSNYYTLGHQKSNSQLSMSGNFHIYKRNTIHISGHQPNWTTYNQRNK